ncbi:hypothetical protein [Campylobacter hyointestinalis]|uniref:hypothetical protein n=1 Tax=Campylobacter hyointestinalis TaxID=198 RepID=UPI000DCC5D6E|nr:hypothetical protein [Campylobacter hyointestinalis]RAZ49183.1 hypothetical protein CHL9004_07825 [Campylobacter hyointestinalis subsp. lawsonii]
MKYCPECETRTNKEYEICPHCGVELVEDKSIQKARELNETDKLYKLSVFVENKLVQTYIL